MLVEVQCYVVRPERISEAGIEEDRTAGCVTTAIQNDDPTDQRSWIQHVCGQTRRWPFWPRAIWIRPNWLVCWVGWNHRSPERFVTMGSWRREWESDLLGTRCGVVLTSQATLFDGTLRENITLARSTITSSDLRRALWLTELEDEVDALPLGQEMRVEAYGETFSPGQILRILVARAIVTHPPLLILEETLHSMPPNTRDIILHPIMHGRGIVVGGPSHARHSRRRPCSPPTGIPFRQTAAPRVEEPLVEHAQ